MISLKAFKEGKIKSSEILASLRQVISAEDLFMFSDYELAYRSLKQFNLRKLERTEESIEKYTQKILALTGLLKNTERPIQVFLAFFLNKSSQLLQVKNQLEAEAKGHLTQVQTLLDHYHTLSFIEEYNSKPSTPRSNEERKLVTFYRRTILKRDEIVQYLLHDILTRAIEKSSSSKSSWPNALAKMEREMERHDDFPYLEMPYGWDIIYVLNMEKLDYRMINPLLNKIGWMDTEKLYGLNYTDEINVTFERRIGKSNFFDRLIDELKEIPVVQERLEIFQEMSELFDERKWYSLYALALPQVEGIFSEMNQLISKKKSSNSLTDKVNLIRSFYEHSHYTFDYYEFTMADLRNSFSHTGKVEDAKTKCFHLLLDIKYLFSVFMELDAPLSKLSKIIKAGASDFKEIGDFNRFIEELQKAKELGKIGMILPMAGSFVYKKLLKEVKFKKMLRLLEQDLIISVKRFNDGIAMLIRDNSFKLFDSTIPNIQGRLPEIIDGYNRMAILVSEQWKLLANTSNVLSSFEVFFPKTPKSIQIELSSIKTKYNKELKIVSYLKSYAKLDVPEDFLLYQRDLIHRIK